MQITKLALLITAGTLIGCGANQSQSEALPNLNSGSPVLTDAPAKAPVSVPSSSTSSDSTAPSPAPAPVAASTPAPAPVPAPAPIVPQLTSDPITNVTVNYGVTCEIVGGNAFCFGANYHGQLGTGDMVSSNQPRPVIGLPIGQVTQVQAGAYGSCAVAGGALYCWGGLVGKFGLTLASLGTGLTPVLVPGMESGVTAISSDTLADWYVVKDGALYCSGCQTGKFHAVDLVQLKDVGNPAGLMVQGLESGVTQISAGFDFGCAIQNGAVKCWGTDAYGQVGDAYSQVLQLGAAPLWFSPNFSPLVRTVPGATSIAAGDDHACAVVNGSVLCWGANGNGQLGNGQRDWLPAPPRAVPSLSGATQVVAGVEFTCALAGGAVYCWGRASLDSATDPASTSIGYLPPDSTGTSYISGSVTPGLAMNLSSGVQAIASGSWSSGVCALLAGGALECWGETTGP